MTTAEKATRWMDETARDNRHGYDQKYRWGEKGDYDCSSAVITAYEKAGIPVRAHGATYTGNMYSAFKACGFKDVTRYVNRTTGQGMQRGDVLLNITHHTALYDGNGNIVQASINEKGTTTGGIPGDQTGREFYIRSYYNYPWNCVLRYTDAVKKKTPNIPSGTKKKPVCTATVTADILNVRKWPGINFANIKNYPKLKRGDRVEICGQMKALTGHIWYYIRIAKKWYGFIDSDYVEID